MHRFFQPCRTGGPVLEGKAGLTVLVEEPAGTQPEFKPAAAQPIEARRFLRQDGRIAKVIIQHERRQSHVRRAIGYVLQQGHRGILCG
jgi:hypothetical protein